MDFSGIILDLDPEVFSRVFASRDVGLRPKRGIPPPERGKNPLVHREGLQQRHRAFLQALPRVLRMVVASTIDHAGACMRSIAIWFLP